MPFIRSKSCSVEAFVHELSSFGSCTDILSIRHFSAEKGTIVLLSKITNKELGLKGSEKGHPYYDVFTLFGKALTPKGSESLSAKLTIFGKSALPFSSKTYKQDDVLAVLNPVIWFPDASVAHIMVDFDEPNIWYWQHKLVSQNNCNCPTGMPRQLPVSLAAIKDKNDPSVFPAPSSSCTAEENHKGVKSPFKNNVEPIKTFKRFKGKDARTNKPFIASTPFVKQRGTISNENPSKKKSVSPENTEAPTGIHCSSWKRKTIDVACQTDFNHCMFNFQSLFGCMPFNYGFPHHCCHGQFKPLPAGSCNSHQISNELNCHPWSFHSPGCLPQSNCSSQKHMRNGVQRQEDSSSDESVHRCSSADQLVSVKHSQGRTEVEKAPTTKSPEPGAPTNRPEIPPPFKRKLLDLNHDDEALCSERQKSQNLVECNESNKKTNDETHKSNTVRQRIKSKRHLYSRKKNYLMLNDPLPSTSDDILHNEPNERLDEALDSAQVGVEVDVHHSFDNATSVDPKEMEISSVNEETSKLNNVKVFQKIILFKQSNTLESAEPKKKPYKSVYKFKADDMETESNNDEDNKNPVDLETENKEHYKDNKEPDEVEAECNKEHDEDSKKSDAKETENTKEHFLDNEKSINLSPPLNAKLVEKKIENNDTVDNAVSGIEDENHSTAVENKETPSVPPQEIEEPCSSQTVERVHRKLPQPVFNLSAETMDSLKSDNLLKDLNLTEKGGSCLAAQEISFSSCHTQLDINEPMSIVYGICHTGCHQMIPYLSLTQKVNNSSCLCGFYTHLVCPDCNKECRNNLTCLSFFFELEIHGDGSETTVIVFGKEAEKFLGISIRDYINNSTMRKKIYSTLCNLAGCITNATHKLSATIVSMDDRYTLGLSNTHISRWLKKQYQASHKRLVI